MAKSTTTKAKTKTPNKKAPAKTASATRSKKVTATKATSSKTSTVTKSANPAETKTTKASEPKVIKTSPAVARRGGFSKLLARGSTPSGLRKLYVISAVLFALLAGAAGVFMKPSSYDLSIGYLTANELLSQSTTVFAAARSVLITVDIRWVAVGILALSAGFSVVGATRMRRSSAEIASGVPQPWRWSDAAVTGGLAVATVAVLSGMQNIVELGLLGLVTAIAFAFAWITERENYRSPTFVRGAFWASVASGVIVLIALATYAIATPVYGMVRYPWYIYAAGGTLVLGALLAVYVRYRSFNRQGSWSSPLFLERNFVLTNLLVKVAVGVILIVGLSN